MEFVELHKFAYDSAGDWSRQRDRSWPFDQIEDVMNSGINPEFDADSGVVTAEIKMGKRRIIEFLLSPVQRAVGESLRGW